MLTLKQIREDKDLAIKRLAVKGFDSSAIIDEIIALDDERKAIQAKVDADLAEMNNISRQIGVMFSQGKQLEANTLKQKTLDMKEATKVLQVRLSEVEQLLEQKIVLLPNFPSELVPEGKSASDNVVVRQSDNIPNLDKATALPHWELAERILREVQRECLSTRRWACTSAKTCNRKAERNHQR